MTVVQDRRRADGGRMIALETRGREIGVNDTGINEDLFQSPHATHATQTPECGDAPNPEGEQYFIDQQLVIAGELGSTADRDWSWDSDYCPSGSNSDSRRTPGIPAS